MIRFSKFWDKSGYSSIVAGMLVPACMCTSYTEQNFSFIGLVIVVGPRGECIVRKILKWGSE
jgi:hypothetical protein